MSKYIRLVWGVVLVLTLLVMGMLVADMAFLQKNLIRFHVVGASDSVTDQQNKLYVRDALLSHIDEVLATADDVSDAIQILQKNKNELQAIAEQALADLHSEQTVKVSLVAEAFPKRNYDTFRLPSGVYNTLRVEIGEGAGENWWCVAFPNFCTPKTVSVFKNSAQDYGFNDTITASLAGENVVYEVHFFILDCLGKLENFFFSMK